MVANDLLRQRTIVILIVIDCVLNELFQLLRKLYTLNLIDFVIINSLQQGVICSCQSKSVVVSEDSNHHDVGFRQVSHKLNWLIFKFINLLQNLLGNLLWHLRHKLKMSV